VNNLGGRNNSCTVFFVLLVLGLSLAETGCREPGGTSNLVFTIAPSGDEKFDNPNQLNFGVHAGTKDTAGFILPEWTHLDDFNKENYGRITFTSRLRTIDSTSKCLVDLFNVTDGVFIHGSLLVTNSTLGICLETEDLADELPAKNITLAVRLRSETQGVRVQGGQSFLRLSPK
jgi:hypothetical protein